MLSQALLADIVCILCIRDMSSQALPADVVHCLVSDILSHAPFADVECIVSLRVSLLAHDSRSCATQRLGEVCCGYLATHHS